MKEKINLKMAGGSQEASVHLEVGSPEYQMIEWLNDGLTDPHIFIDRYQHYKNFSSKVNELIRTPARNESEIWLVSNYCIPVGGFAWSMETFCYNKIPAELSDQIDLTPNSVNLEPEFSLDLEALCKPYVSDRQETLSTAKQHLEAASDILALCNSLHLFVSGTAEEANFAYYRVPLMTLLSAHRNLAYCAEFGYFMVHN